MTLFWNVPLKWLNIAAATIAVPAFASLIMIYYYKSLKKPISAKDAFKLDINVVSESEECKPFINELRRRSMAHGHNAIGFDCEWVSRSSRRPVALLQLSTYDGYCVLIRMNLLDDIPASLRQLLEDKEIYKVGVDPLHDANYVYKDHGVKTYSTIDLRHLAKVCGHTTGGLAHLTETLLGVTLDKRFKIRCSDWDAATLTPEQLHYAASDAHAAILMFVKLINKLNTRIQKKAWSLDPDETVWNSLADVCAKFTDYNYKNFRENRRKEANIKCKEKEVSKRYPNCVRSKPLYDNCLLEAPDGELLCTCDKKKALWYIEKGLADKVTGNPLVVRLRFEPAGRAVGEVGLYYRAVKENRCVVCGEVDSYIRKNVVPREYRKFFPEIMKDRSSHDVVLLCGRCHQRSNIRDQPLRAQLAAGAGAPLQPDTPGRVDDACKKVRMAARALLLHGTKHVLPAHRKKELGSVILDYYTHCDEVTEEVLQQASRLCVVEVKKQDSRDSHGQTVVKYFLNQKPNGLLRLEELWRNHFLTTMKPKHMPALWSVKHNEERLRVKWDEGRLTKEDLKLIGIEGW